MNKVSNGRVVWYGWFSLKLPTRWQVDEIGDAISIFDPDGVGAITLSVLSSGDDAADSKLVALKLIQRFSTQKGWDLPLSSFHLSGNGQSSQCSAEYIQRGDQPPDYWAVTVFAKDGRAVLMSYTAAAFDEPKERAERQKIFEDFRWE